MPVNRRRPLRVEMVLPSLATGGMEAVVARLGRALAARGLDVGFTLTLEEGEFAAQLRADGMEVRLVPQPHRLASIRTASLQARFRRREPDIVHVHSGVWLRAARAARLAATSGVLHTVHGLLNKEPLHGKLIKRLAMRYTDEVVAVSPSLADYLRQEIGIPVTRVQVISNGVDTVQFRPAARTGDLRRQFGIGPQAIVIGTVARLDPIKNQTLILDALPTLLAAGVDAHVLLVGDGRERERLYSQAETLNLLPRVHFAGTRMVDATLHAELDIFALPSHLEGTSISLLEAMACGTPVVATAVGGTATVLDSYPFPGLIAAGDVAAFATACKYFADEPTARARAGTWLRQRVEAHFSEDAMVQQYLMTYDRLMAKHAGERA